MGEVKEQLRKVELNAEEIPVVAQYLLERRDYHSKKRKQFAVPSNFDKMSNAEKGQFFASKFYNIVEKDVTMFMEENIFEGVEFFNDEEKRTAVIQEVCVLYRDLIAPYANSASLAMDMAGVLGQNDPFSRGAMRKVVVTKELGADGTYNTKYSHVGSGLEVIYDKNGVLLMDNVGAGNDFGAIAKRLWNKGYNWTYLERADVWFSTKGIDGRTPEQSVTSYTIIPRSDEAALELVAELEELSKEKIVENKNIEFSPKETQKQKEIEEINNKTNKKVKKQLESLEEEEKELDILNSAAREGKREIKELDWELQPKTAEQVEDDYDKHRSLYADEAWSRMKRMIERGEALGLVEKATIDDYVRIMCYEGQTMIDGWKALCQELPDAYQYLPTKYFQGENCPAEEIILAAKEGMREYLEGKDEVSASDIKKIDAFSAMLDKKNEKEQETLAELRYETEKQEDLKRSLMDKINDAGRFK